MAQDKRKTKIQTNIYRSNTLYGPFYRKSNIYTYHPGIFNGESCIWCKTWDNLWEESISPLEAPEVPQLEAYRFQIGVVILHLLGQLLLLWGEMQGGGCLLYTSDAADE